MTWEKVFESLMCWAGELRSRGLPRSMRRLRAPASFARRCAEMDDADCETLLLLLRHLIRHGLWPEGLSDAPEDLRWLLWLRLDFAMCRIPAFRASGFPPPASAEEWISRIALRGWPVWRRDVFRLAAIEHLCPHADLSPPPSPPWLR